MTVKAFIEGRAVPLTSGLSIRLIEHNDLQNIIEMLGNPKVAEYLFFAPAPVEVYEGYFGPIIEETRQALDEGRLPGNVVGIIRDVNGRYMGMFAATSVMFLEGNVEVGYQLPEHAWRQGIATQGCQFMTRLAFEFMNAHKVCADCYATNVGSYKTLEKCGFEREGVQIAYYKRGQDFEDRIHYGMTLSQYQASVK